MSYCEHCEGQRFDRAQVLRAVRQIRRQLRATDPHEGGHALDLVLNALKSLEIPHLDVQEFEDEIIH